MLYGLKVLGKFSDDTWIDPFRHPGNWYRAYHGTKNAKLQDFRRPVSSTDPNLVSVEEDSHRPELLLRDQQFIVLHTQIILIVTMQQQ